MRKMRLLAVIFLSSTILLAGSALQPLNVKTGLWDVTMTTAINGMGKPQTRNYKSCIKKEDLDKYPFADPDKRCTYTVVSSTGTTMEAHGTCQPGSEGAKIDFNLRLEAVDSENVKGTGQMNMSMEGRTMDGNYNATAKWIGATCPAGTK